MSIVPSSTSSSLSFPSSNNISVYNINQLVTLNAAQLPIKLASTNFPSWRCQFSSILLGYDLLVYIAGSYPSPEPLVTVKETHADDKNVTAKTAPNPAYHHWIRQDQLLLLAIIASASESVVPFISSAATSKETWEKIQKMYANWFRSRMMSLKDKLTKPRGGKIVTEYFQSLKVISHELALINSLVLDDDLVIKALNGIGSEYKELAAGILARADPISFEELMDKFIEYEEAVKQQELVKDSFNPTAHCLSVTTKK